MYTLRQRVRAELRAGEGNSSMDFRLYWNFIRIDVFIILFYYYLFSERYHSSSKKEKI